MHRRQAKQLQASRNCSGDSCGVADAGVLREVALAGLVIAVELDLQSRPAVLPHLFHSTHKESPTPKPSHVCEQHESPASVNSAPTGHSKPTA